MKKLLLLALVLLISLSLLVSCEYLRNTDGTGDSSTVDTNGTTENPDDTTENPDDTTENPDDTAGNPDDTTEKPDDTTEKPDDTTENPDDTTGNPDDTTEKPDDTTENPDDTTENPDDAHKYLDFTEDEREILLEYVGAVIPFIPNEEYYVDSYYGDGDYSEGINYYAFDNTPEEFEAYLALFTDYELTETYEDWEGDTWYVYEKDDVTVELAYYSYESSYIVDVYVTSSLSTGGNTGGGSSDTLYTDFTDAEKAIFEQYIGIVIPFIPSCEYYVDSYYGDGDYSEGVNYYAFDNTPEEFEAYLALFTDYEYIGEDEDADGIVWYVYEREGVTVEAAHYESYGYYVVDVYVTSSLSTGGNTGGDDSGNGNTGGDNTGSSDDSLITNAGAGLPEGTNGVFDVDLTDAEQVKDVTDQGYYLGGCPTVGSPAVLVIPVEFSDVTAADKGYTTDALRSAFLEGGVTDYYSLYDYYYTSSYGKLTLDITVLDFWFRPEYSSSYYRDATYDYYGDTVAIGDQLILDEALAYLSGIMDLSAFDSDGNDIIDAVVLVNTLDVNSDSDFQWAYRYWNIYTDSDGYYYEYDGVSANDYIWASYQFLHESVDESGEVDYDGTGINTYTFIHEFGHILGADDYYDTAYVGAPMEGCDIMDSMSGDHNAYTKFNFGWITDSRLVVTDTSVTLTLTDFSVSGDTIIIANNWDSTLGAYQEYYIVVYYTNDGLNSDGNGYFSREGIVVYHVNASLYVQTEGEDIYYNVYNNNTDPSDSYGTADNLIEYVKTAADRFVFVAGDTLPTVTDDSGNALAYTFTVDSIEGDVATVTFTRV